MANPEHLEILKSGKDTFNAWRDEHPGVPVDLSGANLAKMNLAYYDLAYANLRDAELHGADLWRANLRDAKLQGTNLWRANLRDANLRDAELRDAELQGANLWGANLWGANLRDAELQGAELQGANLWRANLQGADLQGANLIFGAQDVRGYQCLLTYSRKTGAVDIQFGCRRWHSFEDARAHFGPGYQSGGNPDECLLILDNLESRYNLRMRREADK